jgi:hypothetical protein
VAQRIGALSHAEKLRCWNIVRQGFHRLAKAGTIEQISGEGRTLRWRVRA